jgi:hypothetical protein
MDAEYRAKIKLALSKLTQDELACYMIVGGELMALAEAAQTGQGPKPIVAVRSGNEIVLYTRDDYCNRLDYLLRTLVNLEGGTTRESLDT